MTRIDGSTARRLETRRNDDETLDDLIHRLLDETPVELSLELILEALHDQYDHASGISVDVPLARSTGTLRIFVHMSDLHVDFPKGTGQVYELMYDNSETRVVIEETALNPRYVFSVEVIEMNEDPERTEHNGSIPVYIPDDATGGEPIPLTEGINRVRKKLGRRS